jgi:flagellar hook-basal body complex protein FliE
MNEISKIPGFSSLSATDLDPKVVTPSKGDAPKFDDMLKGFMSDVNKMQKTADTSIQKMVAGEVKDVHQVMLAVEEAKVAFNLMLEIRNKTMEAYNELIRMRG